jgi:hypothetical protein
MRLTVVHWVLFKMLFINIVEHKLYKVLVQDRYYSYSVQVTCLSTCPWLPYESEQLHTLLYLGFWTSLTDLIGFYP